LTVRQDRWPPGGQRFSIVATSILTATWSCELRMGVMDHAAEAHHGPARDEVES